MGLDESDLESFMRSIEVADIYRLERILEGIDPDRLKPGLVDVDLELLARKMERSLELMDVMLGQISNISPEPRLVETYIGSTNSDRYHRPQCRLAEKISPKNLVRFSDTKEAKARGYVPCGVCKPS